MFRSFLMGGDRYRYFCHPYNDAWNTERTVEVPIVMREIKGIESSAVLEVGNVLRHYTDVSHDVVDKYEKVPGVVNRDIVDFQVPKRYERIVSISTLEHVGWDEEQRSETKIPTAVANMKSLLAPQGVLLVTFPVGHNQYLDEMVAAGTLEFQEISFMSRASLGNKWVQCTWEGIKNCQYNEPYRCANGLVVARYRHE